MSPGPYLTVTVTRTLQKGRLSAFLMLVGHAVLEALLLVGFAFGLQHFLNRPTVATLLGATPPYRDEALEALGDMNDFVIAMQARPELRSWAFRFPRLALIAYPLMCLALLPVYPVSAGVTHAPNIARWGFCFMCAGLVTVSILLGLRLAILFG